MTLLEHILLTALFALTASIASRTRSPLPTLISVGGIATALWLLLEGLSPITITVSVMEPPLLVATLGTILYCGYRFRAFTAYVAIALFLCIGFITAEFAQYVHHLPFTQVLADAALSGLPLAFGGIAALYVWKVLKNPEEAKEAVSLTTLQLFAVSFAVGLTIDSSTYLLAAGEIDLNHIGDWLPHAGYKLAQKLFLGCGIAAPIFIVFSFKDEAANH